MRAISIRSAVLAAACLCGTAVPLAQQQPPRASLPNTGMIAGVVMDAATKKPIPSAMVGLGGGSAGPVGRGGAPRQLLTDSQGRFAFAALGPGRYTIFSQRAGYWSVPIATSRSIELGPEQKVTDVIVRLHQLASISGTVTDENGDAVTGIGVVAFGRLLQSGQMISVPAGEGRTDDRGIYKIEGIAAGDYVVCACRRDPMPVDGVLLTTLAADPAQLLGLASRALKVGADVAAVDGARTFPPTFHPAAALMSRATHVAVNFGEERAGIDIQMPVVRALRISGRIVGAPSGVTSTAIRLRPAGEAPEVAPLIEPMLVQPDGRFDFVNVPAGTYVINAVVPTVATGAAGPSGTALAFLGGRGLSGPPPPPPAPNAPPQDRILMWGQATVTLADADVTGVTIPIQRLADVTVKTELPPEVTQIAQSVRLAGLSPIGFDPRGIAALSRVNQNGTFVIPNVAPGRYWLNLSTALPTISVRVGGRDVTDQPIEVGDTPIGDIVVTLGNFVATTISGTVADRSEDLCVLLFPADPKLWVEPAAAQRWFSTVPVGHTGTFESNNNLPPGNYLVIAVPDEQALNWQTKSKLEALAPRAQKVTVAAGEKKVIEVKR